MRTDPRRSDSRLAGWWPSEAGKAAVPIDAVAIVAHASWCAVQGGGYCDCEPFAELRKRA
jgi:hypothetical protein